MRQEAEAVVRARLTDVDVGAMYLADNSEPGLLEEDLVCAFDEAAPTLVGERPSPQTQICVLGTPRGEAGGRIQRHARQALSDVELATIATQDDVFFYREIPQLPLAELKQLGPKAYDAYCRMTELEHFTPHSRTDILEWRAAAVV
jgi:hypothetical protein